MTNDSSDRLSLKNQALERAARARKGGARKPNKPKAPPVFAPGARVVIRDEEWMVRRTTGAAFGGAVGLAACCDIVVASEKAKFCLSEVNIGLSPAVISPYVQRALGQRQMRRYALTAEVMDAPTALSLGLAHQVVEHDALDNAVDSMIATLVKGSPQAQRATKALLATVAQAPDADATREHTCQVIAKLRVSQEGQEGLASFLDKRRPAWTSPAEHNNAAEPRS